MLAPSPSQAPASSRGGCSRERPCGGLLILDLEHEITRLRAGALNVPTMRRCLNGHTFLDPVVPMPRLVYRATCGYCETPVNEQGPSGKFLLNHARCASILRGVGHAVRHSHRWVEVPADG